MQNDHPDEEERDEDGTEPAEIAIVGDLTEQEGDVLEKLLEIPVGGQCTLYFDSPGGSAYSALSLMTVIAMRELDATGIVTGECSSAALWPLAACRRRYVTAFSVLLFHPMRWQSEEGVQLPEAAEWARHFATLEKDMDDLLARFLGVSRERLSEWMKPGRYVGGVEFAETGLAELVDLMPVAS